MLEAERLRLDGRPRRRCCPTSLTESILRYLRPSPLQETVELRGVVVSADEAEIVAEVELRWDGKARAACDRAVETLEAPLMPPG